MASRRTSPEVTLARKVRHCVLDASTTTVATACDARGAPMLTVTFRATSLRARIVKLHGAGQSISRWSYLAHASQVALRLGL